MELKATRWCSAEQLAIRVAVLMTCTDTALLIDTYLDLHRDRVIKAPDFRTEEADCLFCKHQQYHVPHIEQHIRDGFISTSMWRAAEEHAKGLILFPRNDDPATIGSVDKLKGYLLWAMQEEEKLCA